jgi:hypothetical protein
VKIHTTAAIVAILLGICALTGCAKKNQTPEAVRQGVIRDISKSFNVANMDVVVDAVSFRDKEADATVTFLLKGGSRDQGMSMKYVMEQHDDGQWYIKSRASGSGGAESGAPAAGAMPAGHPAMGGGEAASGSKLNLPPDHPSIQ